MKTPMQELVEEMEQSHLMFAPTIALIKEKNFLEKEKEQIVNAWMDDRFPLDKDWVKRCAEQYYNETFNTKEK